MRDYELVVVLSPDVGDEGYPAVVERIGQAIQERGGAIKNVDQWGRRRLAYPIRRNLDAYYAVTHFTAEPRDIKPLEASLDLAEDVLRHLVVRLDEAAPAPPAAPPVESEPAPVAAAAEED